MPAPCTYKNAINIRVSASPIVKVGCLFFFLIRRKQDLIIWYLWFIFMISGWFQEL